jgi:hypothetical protein
MTMSGRWSVEQISGGTVNLLWSKSIKISQSWAQERRLDMTRFGGIVDGWTDITKDDEIRGVEEETGFEMLCLAKCCSSSGNMVRSIESWRQE